MYLHINVNHNFRNLEYLGTLDPHMYKSVSKSIPTHLLINCMSFSRSKASLTVTSIVKSENEKLILSLSLSFVRYLFLNIIIPGGDKWKGFFLFSAL